MIDWKKVAWISGGVVIAGAFLWWLKNQVANSQANAQASSDQQAQTDAQLSAMLLQNPLASANYTAQPVATSTPTVDTGNASLQTLINSILNPPSQGASSTVPSQVAPSTPPTSIPTTPSDNTSPSVPANPAQIPGGTPVANPVQSGGPITIQPGIVRIMQPLTNTVQ